MEETNYIIEKGVLKKCLTKEKHIHIPKGVEIIGKDAFKGLTNITTVSMADTVTHIEERAFKGCKNLEIINFSKQLVGIEAYAFHKCHALKSIDLPLKVKKIAKCTFLYCDSVEHVSIPNVAFIDQQGFANCYRIKSLEVSAQLDVSQLNDVFTGCSKIREIIIYKGQTYKMKSLMDILSGKDKLHPVIRGIGKDIFKMMDVEDSTIKRMLVNAKDIDIPEGIEEIGKSCFYDKKGLISITLPKTLKKISQRAFRNCMNLEKVILKNSDVIIEEDAFKNCSALKYIELPNSQLFELKGLVYTNNHRPMIIDQIHSQMLNNYRIIGTCLYDYYGSEERVILPEGITEIAEGAFEGKDCICHIVFPKSVEKIGNRAFKDCILLQSIEWSSNIKIIGESAFENCLKLLKLEWPKKVGIIHPSTFKRCRALKTIILPDNLKKIAESAFYGCKKIKQIDLPNTIFEISDMAFYKCEKLESLSLPDSLKKIGNNAFANTGIKHLNMDCELIECGSNVFSNCQNLKSIHFSEKVKMIGHRFAYHCEHLEMISCSKNLLHIGKYAFEKTLFRKKLNRNGIFEHMLIDGSAYKGSALIDSSVTTIAGGAFLGNESLINIKIGEHVRAVGPSSFCGCSQLRNCTWPSQITHIKEGTFAYCTNLEKIIHQGNIESIADNSFLKCQSLVEVPSGQNLTIGHHAFNGCRGLSRDKLSLSSIGEDAFIHTPMIENSEDILVIIDKIVVDGSKAEGHVRIPNDVKDIAPYAFARNEKVTSLTFPDGIKSIGKGAFSGCHGLKEIHLHSKVCQLDDEAFEKCNGLQNVDLEVKEISNHAFIYCSQLVQVDMNQTKKLGNGVFRGCYRLKEVTHKSIDEIGERCFSGCEALESFDFTNIKHIKPYAFEHCNSLKKLELCDLENIESNAFCDCHQVEYIQLMTEYTQWSHDSFSGCTWLDRINDGHKTYHVKSWLEMQSDKFPSSVKRVYFSAMSCFSIIGSDKLIKYSNASKRVKIPEGIKVIDKEVFREHFQLEEINIPKSLIKIGERAFIDTTWLKNKGHTEKIVIVNNHLIYADKLLEKIHISSEVKCISGWAMTNCFHLKHVVISNETVIEPFAFRNCIHIKTVTLDGVSYKLENYQDKDDHSFPEKVRRIFHDALYCLKVDEDRYLKECTGNIKTIHMVDGITTIGKESFKMSNLLNHMKFSLDTQHIEENAFDTCKWLQSVSNTKFIKSIGSKAFSRCYHLKNIEPLVSLEEIGKQAFEYCSSLESIVIGEGVRRIPKKAFYRCVHLKIVHLPDTIEYIDDKAFAYCRSLKKINLDINKTKLGNEVFKSCDGLNQ